MPLAGREAEPRELGRVELVHARDGQLQEAAADARERLGVARAGEAVGAAAAVIARDPLARERRGDLLGQLLAADTSATSRPSSRCSIPRISG